MGNSISLYGLIGYTYLTHNTKNPKFILILADNHSKLPYCNNYTMISDWLKKKSLNNNILLEEVPRDNITLKEIFSTSDHTQKLKELFINNPKVINGIDIRPYLIKFSWELLELANIDQIKDISFNFFLEDIDNFFNFKNNKIKKLNKHYNEIDIQKLNCHIQFKIIKDNYLNYKKKYEDHLNKNIVDIFNNHKYILEECNNILDNIMEFYIILNVFNKNNKNIIIHTGLAHSEKIIFWLTQCYFYETSEEKGITKVKDIEKLTINNNGCLNLSKTIDDHL
jgi:hypothetical protein